MRSSADPDGEPVEARPSLRLALDPTFGRYFVGRLSSTFGVWIHNVVAAIVVYRLTGSAALVGLVSVLQFGPQLLLSPFTGALADRGGQIRQVFIGRVVVAAGSILLALWLAVVGEEFGGATPVLVAAVVVGTGFVIGGPAMNSMIPHLVRPSELASAVSLNTIPITVGRAVGPAIGTLIATSLGAAPAFAVAGLGNVVFAWLLTRLPKDLEPAPPPRTKLSSELLAGFRHLGADRGTLLILLGVTAVGIGADPPITLSPPLADELGRGDETVGAIVTAFGVGSGLIFLGLGQLRRLVGVKQLAVIGVAAEGLGLILAGLRYDANLVLAGFVLSGAGMTMGLTALGALLHERLPDRVRGRVMALWGMAFLGSRPVAAAVDGLIADLLTARIALLIVGTAVTGLAVLVTQVGPTGPAPAQTP